MQCGERITEVSILSNNSPGRDTPGDQNSPARAVGVVACVSGLLAGVAALAVTLTGIVGDRGVAGASIAVDSVGIFLGIAGYALGSRYLGPITIVFCLLVMFLGLVASQGLIPGTDTAPAGRDAF